MNIIISMIVISIVGWAILKKFKSQTVLLISGLSLMFFAYLLGYKTDFVAKKFMTGFFIFDMFEYIHQLLIKDVAGLGLMIMVCTGFAKYMDHIGASSAMVQLSMKPLAKLNAPYLVMSASFLLCMFMALFIPSASGLAMLMMVTIYPVLIKLGVSKLAAASVVATGHILDIGPASATTLLVSKTTEISINKFFVENQLPVYLLVGIAGTISHYFWQKYLDRKSNLTMSNSNNSKTEKDNLQAPGPNIYVILPLLPLLFLLGFSEYGYAKIKMNVNLAMFLSFAIAMIFEIIRYREFKKVAASIQKFFNGMSEQFANTVTLITAGQAFAYGLTSMGVIDATIAMFKGLGVGVNFVTLGICLLIILISMVMGSGVAAMFSFAPLIPGFANGLNGNAVTMLQAIQNSASLGRLLSPITAVIVAVAGIADVSPVDLIKRNSVPVITCIITSMLAIFILF